MSMRSHLPHVRRTITKNRREKYWRGCEEKSLCARHGNGHFYSTIELSMEVPPKTKHRTTMYRK